MKKLFKHWVVAPAFAAACWGTVGAIGAEVNSPAPVLKHASTDGQTFCAVMLKANDLPKGVVSRNHIILIDTSASQVGEHRQFGMGVVQSLLDSLPETDQVRLFAVDLGAESLMTDFASPRSEAVQNGMKTLKSRVPLGATNLQAGLEAALKAAVSGQSTDIAYIGDGMSTADLIESAELRNLLGSLRTRQIPVHGVGIGPKINGQLLGILAHQTGGSLALDLNTEVSADGSKVDVSQTATKQGTRLATAMKKPVFFPNKLDVSTTGTELLPNQPLPIRTDRETIYVARGSFPAQTKIVMSDADGQSMEWSLAAAVTKPEHGFLPEFVQHVATDGGLSNPLAGASMLVVAQDQFKNRVESLAQQGATALAKRDVKQARHLADLALQADPNNEFAQALGTATKKFQIRTVSQQDTDAAAAPAGDDLENKVAPNPNASTLDEQQRSITVKTEKLRNQVSSAIESSRRNVDPESGIGQLKQALNAVRSAIDVAPEDRAQLQKRLDSEIQIQVNQKEQKVAAVNQALQQRAQQEAKQRLAEQFILEEERLETYIDRVRSLMNEGRHGRDSAYGEAQIVSEYAIDLRPGDGTSMAARFSAEAAEQLLRSYRLRNRRADQWLETLHQVELSHVPFPDEPPIRFPAAEVWRQLTERRKKWATVDLKRNSPNEQRIQRALSDSTEVAFSENTLEEAMNFLEEMHNIEIWLDKKAMENGDATPETPVTLSMSGVSLRSVLRLILEPLKLTYIIEDEVMKITTVDEADLKMSTRVYPVADLVVPPQANLGGQGGQQGGGQQGGGQQGGGFGGGGGGGGFGGGGGGGFFNVPQQDLLRAVPNQQPVEDRNLKNRDDAAVDILKKKLRASR